MRSRSPRAGAVTTVAALVMASAMLFTTPGQAEAGEPARPSAAATDAQRLTPLLVQRVTRRGVMVEVRGRTDPRAEVTVNGRPVPLIAKDGSFTFFLAMAPRERSGRITVTAQASGSTANTLTLKPDASE